jgi:hypothetical protein
MEVGAMFARVGDVVGQTGQPLQRVHGLKVATERGIHAGSIQHGLVAVEIDELLERERIPDDVGEFLGDRVSLDQARQQALAEQLHHRVSVPRLERVKRTIVRERALGHEKVTMRMPLQKVAGAGDRGHDAGHLEECRYRWRPLRRIAI